MLTIIKLYRLLILIPLSGYLNLFYRIKYNGKWKQVKSDAKHYRKVIKSVIDLSILKAKYIYIADPLWGFANYTPTLESFIARGGADCSGWSKIIAEFVPNSKRFLIMNGFNIFSLHFVTTLKTSESSCIGWNVSSQIKGKTEFDILQMFKNGYMVEIHGKQFKYDKLKVWEW